MVSVPHVICICMFVFIVLSGRGWSFSYLDFVVFSFNLNFLLLSWTTYVHEYLDICSCWAWGAHLDLTQCLCNIKFPLDSRPEAMWTSHGISFCTFYNKVCKWLSRQIRFLKEKIALAFLYTFIHIQGCLGSLWVFP